MYKRILFALDLEGVNRVAGEPYTGLSRDTADYEIAIHQAALEINAAAGALFDLGVERIDLWDNHGGGHNIIPREIDSRIHLLDPDRSRPRMYFADDRTYDCICFFGYHAMEGTLGGVLAHTMNSKQIQYYKLNGQYIGEVDMDAYIAASHGIPTCFFAAGDITCAQAARAVPGIVTVTTKKEISRNEAEFRNNNELFVELRREIIRAVQGDMPIRPLSFPATVEKSFKRVEDAAAYLARLRSQGIFSNHPNDDLLGKDAHSVTAEVNNIAEFIYCI
ncbi:MAG: M55 family metallopeptidase [Clostridia bacterium]|nr:M55 family metallopeptidase [Clostridia bacterium]